MTPVRSRCRAFIAVRYLYGALFDKCVHDVHKIFAEE